LALGIGASVLVLSITDNPSKIGRPIFRSGVVLSRKMEWNERWSVEQAREE